ncbi:MAG: nicotinate phosphoribosyltransferase [Myxococcales bacterium]|nr:nicotinate phosphoribosyltransferase [Myxococcales bacterium]
MPTQTPAASSLALLTDLYQLTMAYGYWKSGTAEQESVFHLFFRRHPFKGGFTVTCGQQPALDYLEAFRFESADVDYLATLTGNDGASLFEDGFLRHLSDLRLEIEVDAMAEGTVAFPHEPILRVRGPLLQCQLLETPLLNIVNFQTLIATKAARICMATGGEPVLEFGLRRAQGVDGALAASRAAYVGGCAATSNVLAGRLHGIPVKGTHAHSWVMSFESEREAFETYASAMPNNCVFLVDTYDTLEGVRQAIEVGRELRARGHEMVGIRLDSGDLAWLSIEARKLLDAAGFEQASIVASNDLDEHLIRSLKQQDAKIGVWGVGTKLATAYDQPALGGVYKLAALREPGGDWRYTVKLSEQAIKISNPGLQQVVRFREGERFVGDALYNEAQPPGDGALTMIDPADATRQKRFEATVTRRPLLQPALRGGARVAEPESLEEVRERVQQELAGFHRGIKRFDNPHSYPVGLEQGLFELKDRLVRRARRLS